MSNAIARFQGAPVILMGHRRITGSRNPFEFNWLDPKTAKHARHIRRFAGSAATNLATATYDSDRRGSGDRDWNRFTDSARGGALR